MQNENKAKEKDRESIFLSEKLMTAVTAFIAAAGLISLIFFRSEMDLFEIFGLLVKIVTSAAIYFAFRGYKWDVAKGLLGGVLFSLMYNEAYLVLAKLWAQDFDTYLIAGVWGSLYLAAAGMSLWMTLIITVDHFIVNYTLQSNPKNLILNRFSIVFKFISYILLLTANSQLKFSTLMIGKNAIESLIDMAILLLVIMTETQFDTFKKLRQELLAAKRGAKNK